MYDAPGWNMMPMYPISHISSIQPLHDSGDNHQRWHRQEPWGHYTAYPNAPTQARVPRAVYIQNLSPTTTTADLKSLLQMAGNVEQCNVTVTSDAYDNRAQTHGSAVMHSVEEAKRAVASLNNMCFMGSRIRVKVGDRPAILRSGSWDGSITQESDTSNESGSELSSVNGDQMQSDNGQKAVDPGKPFVVDGSGQHRRRSLDVLSTSAPT